MTFDYNILKKTLKALCDEYDEQVLMPTKSPYLSIENDNEFTYVLFNGERIPFLDRDLTLLPIRNVTVEELAHHLLERLIQDAAIAALDIEHLLLRCASGEGQWASAEWRPSLS
mgnify:FL=1